MAITLNKVGVEIDGKVYQFYKLSFGFQRRLVEVQSNINKLRSEIAKKYSIEVGDLVNSDQVTDEEKMQIATASLEMQDVIKQLFVNKEEADILDNFDVDNMTELFKALQ